ncbi:MAG TPA: hypothetical protein VH079_17780 [Terriglobales bacterium]|jgi:hypothetical protein|nr:hypothetical protein [Terriglobales bacterium]
MKTNGTVVSETEIEKKLKFPMWQSAYQEALFELNAVILLEKVTRAEHAIDSRLQQLEESNDSRPEIEAMMDARSSLRFLKSLHAGRVR